MRNVSTEQELVDTLVVSTYVDDFLAEHGDVWMERFDLATERVDGLYAEFTPELSPRARRLGRLLGGSGMAFLETRYGVDETDAGVYSGSYESDVLAIQHNGLHSWNFLRNMLRYASYINARAQANDQEPPYDQDFFTRVPHIAAFHDAIMGNGRGHDERQAALYAGRLFVDLSSFGTESGADEPTMAAIEATTWDIEKQQQLVYSGEDWPLYRTAARVADLLTSTDPEGAYEGLRVILEDLTKRQQDRALTLMSRERGFNVEAASMEERLEFIDGTPLRSRFAALLDNQASFIRRLPLADPTITQDFSGNLQNAEILQVVSSEYRGRTMTAVDVRETLWNYANAA